METSSPSQDTSNTNNGTLPYEQMGKRTTMNRRTPILIAAGSVVVIALVVGAYILGASRQSPPPVSQSPTRQPTSPPSTSLQTISPSGDSSVPTLRPPLAGVQFPTQTVDYPPEWPSDLHYPQDFHVVEAYSGPWPADNTAKGWIAKLRYTGIIGGAADTLTSFFTTNGWQVEQIDLDAGRAMLTVEKDNKQKTGSFVLDRDTNDPGSTIILATIRL